MPLLVLAAAPDAARPPYLPVNRPAMCPKNPCSHPLYYSPASFRDQMGCWLRQAVQTVRRGC